MTIVCQILAAIRSGCETSNEIAAAIRARRNNVSVALFRLADLGVVDAAERELRPDVLETMRIPVGEAAAVVTSQSSLPADGQAHRG